jgi:glycosyltransferase involved in cell wall biosynthesis
MSAGPAVSAVIATRNRPELLADAIASVRGQEFDGVVETIVVFDQSEPDSELASDDARRPVRVVANTRKPGLAGARNTGIENARGEYVAFCDDDDYWLPAKLARQVEALNASPHASLVSCGIRVLFGRGAHDRVLPAERIRFADLLRDRHTELHPSTFVMRRASVVAGFGLVDEDVPGGFGEDYEFLLRAARSGEIANVTEVLAVVRWHQNSYFFRRWDTMAAGLAWLLDEYPEFDEVRAGSARLRGQIAFAHAARRRRREALRWAGTAARRNPLEPRVPLALAVMSGLISADRIMTQLHRHGKGI